MIVALLLVWIAFTAFAVSGLAWLEPHRSGAHMDRAPIGFAGPDEHFEGALTTDATPTPRRRSAPGAFPAVGLG